MGSNELDDITRGADELARSLSKGEKLDKQAALALYHSAYHAFPAGGSPRETVNEYRFLDGSGIQVVDGVENNSLKIEERNHSAHCERVLPYIHDSQLSPQENLGEAIDCMIAAHGRKVLHSDKGIMTEYMDGSNLQWKEKLWSLPQGQIVIGESTLSRSTLFEARKDLTIMAETEDANDFMTILKSGQKGQLEKIRFSHNSEKAAAPVILESLEIFNGKGAVVKSKRPALALE